MSNTIDSHLIAKSIKNLRLRDGLTQKYVAESMIYTSERNLRRYEHDGTTDIDVVNAYAEAFQVSAIDILMGVFFYPRDRVFLLLK